MDIDSIEALLAEAEVKLGDRETMAAGRLLLDAGQAWLELLEDDTQQEWKRLKEECMQEARSFFAMDFGRMETRFVIGRQRGVFLGQEVEVVAEVVYRIRPLVGRGGGEEGGSQADGAGGAGSGAGEARHVAGGGQCAIDLTGTQATTGAEGRPYAEEDDEVPTTQPAGDTYAQFGANAAVMNVMLEEYNAEAAERRRLTLTEDGARRRRTS